MTTDHRADEINILLTVKIWYELNGTSLQHSGPLPSSDEVNGITLK
jgi:hypothetical protein